LERCEVPASPEEVEFILSGFYRNERLPELKLNRLKRFLSSWLARRLWTATAEEVAKDFLKIWYKLAGVMGQSRDAKTITFAMKCLGIALLMAGRTDFGFEDIPIPVDYRVGEFTRRLGVIVRMMKTSGNSGMLF
jgi:DNA-(apurinic or apyrimidinic site) lyase